MKKKIYLSGILAILLCVGLSGCNYISDLFLSDDDKLIGTWNNDGSWLEEVPAVITFFTNGTIKINFQVGGTIGFFSQGTWDMQEGILAIEIEEVLQLTNYGYQFTEENTILTLTETDTNESYILIKQ